MMVFDGGGEEGDIIHGHRILAKEETKCDRENLEEETLL